MSALDPLKITEAEPDVESSTLDYKKRFSGKTGEWFVQRQSEALIQVLSHLDERMEAVDFGGGHGQNIDPLRRLGFRVTILGSAPSCSGLISDQIANGDVHFYQASLTKSDLPDCSFQVVTSFRLLPHLSDWQGHIHELCRVSSDVVVIEFPTSHSINIFSSGLFHLKKKIEKNTRSFALFSLKNVEHEFNKNGYVLSQRVGQYVLPMAFYRLIKVPVLAKTFERFFSAIGVSKVIGSPMVCCFTRESYD